MPPRFARIPIPRTTTSRTTARTTARGAVVALFLLTALFLAAGPGAAPALASCAVGAPRASESSFAGTVVALSRGGRVAQVRTDRGEDVEVRGTPARPDPPGGTAATSVDRTYELGTRYEFHPVNAASPFADDICTATHLLPSLPAEPAPDGVGPFEVVRGGLFGLAGALVLLMATVAVRRLRRRGLRSDRHLGSDTRQR